MLSVAFQSIQIVRHYRMALSDGEKSVPAPNSVRGLDAPSVCDKLSRESEVRRS
jgi:hypothetical protein